VPADAPPSHPLAGVRVLDLTRVIAGPYCTRILCDLGADVYKVEPPAADIGRGMGKRVRGLSGVFMQHNAGKRCLCIDIDKPGGGALVLELVPHVDVLVDNFRPGVMDRLGLDEAALRAKNPRLVHCMISGFGHDSPSRDKRAFAGVIHAMTGLLDSQARADSREPTDIAHALADTATGVHAAVAILAALVHRARTGEGQTIDLAMHDVMLSLNESCGEHLFDSPDALTTFYRATVVRGRDGHLNYQGDPVWLFDGFVAALGRPDLRDDPRFVTPELRREHRTALMQILADWVMAQPSVASASTVLEANGHPNGVVRTLPEALKSPETLARGMVRHVDDRRGGSYPVLDTPYRFSRAQSGVRGTARYRGEDNRAVLKELCGFDDARLDALEREGVLIRTEKKKP
jgi:crotonobetainyl-CoA:carnitine CoA-transferase CaiB-like acyl-CoA transferase